MGVLVSTLKHPPVPYLTGQHPPGQILVILLGLRSVAVGVVGAVGVLGRPLIVSRHCESNASARGITAPPLLYTHSAVSFIRGSIIGGHEIMMS